MPTLFHRPRTEPAKTPAPLAERVTADFRRSVVYGILAAAAYGVSRGFDVRSEQASHRIVAYACGAAFVLFGLLAVELAVSLSGSNAGLKHILAAVFFVVSFFFVYRSFYGMRINVATTEEGKGASAD